MATYESNHILGYISGSKVHNKLHSLLQVNKNSSPASAARQKIITTHFSDANVKQFLDMDEEVYPHVIAWMARDKDGLSLLSTFLCDISGSIGDWQKGAKEQPTRSSADTKQLLGSVDEEMTSKLDSIDIQDSQETKLPKRFCGRSYAEQLSIVFSESCQRRIPSEVMEEQMKKIDAREAAEPEGRGE